MTTQRIAVAGAMGRMGQAILRLAGSSSSLAVTGALEAKGHASIGQSIESLLAIPGMSVRISDSPEKVLKEADLLITFTNPRATLEHMEACLRAKKGMVVGTTALSESDQREIKTAAEKIPVVLSPNMSVGVNLLLTLMELAAKKLGPEYDLEITEIHHRLKKDAPSGTALKLAEVAAAARGEKLPKVAEYGRQGITGERKQGSIGIHALRGGDVIGEHTVEFMAAGERVGFFHKATSRDAFARGALLAARFLEGKKSGLWSMKDVLGL